MIVYLSAMLLSIVLTYTKLGKKRGEVSRNKSRILYTISALIASLPFVIISCLRYNVGTDYSTYIEFYPHYVFTLKNSTEPLFYVLIYFCTKVINYPRAIVVFFGLTVSPFFLRYIYRYSKSICLSIIVFFFSGIFNISLNIMRQMLATAIFFWAIQYIEKRDWKKYCIAILISTLMHEVSIIFFAFYFIGRVRLKNKTVFLIVILSAFLPNLAAIFLEFISSKFGFYRGYVLSQYNVGMSYSLLGINAIAFICSMLYLNKDQSERAHILVNLQLVAIVLCEWMNVIPNGGRLVFSLMPVQCVLIPNTIKTIKKRYRFLIGAIIIVSYVAFFISYFYVNNYGQTFPYQFFRFG